MERREFLRFGAAAAAPTALGLWASGPGGASPAFGQNAATGRDSVPDVRDWWQVKGDGENDDSAALSRAARESLALSFPPNRTYVVDGTLRARSGGMWFGPATSGNSDTRRAGGSPKLVFTGRGAACIANQNPEAPLSHFGMAGLTVQSEGDYEWMVDLRHSVGVRMRDLRLQTNSLTTGGIRSQKLEPGASWVNNWTQVEVRLPQESRSRPLDVDFSDSAILGGNFSGGLGSALRGTGAVKLIGTRLDITNAEGAGITIFKQHESTGYHALIGCQIEENLGHGVLIDADSDDRLQDPNILTLIDGCQFRNHGGARADIRLKNNTGQVMRGPRIQGNVHTLPEHAVYVLRHIEYDPDRWSEDPVIFGAYRDKPQATLYVGGQERQPRLDLLNWSGNAAVEGADAEAILRVETIQGYTMGPNDALSIEADWELEGPGLLRVSFGGTAFTSFTVSEASFVRTKTVIRNQGSRTAQRGAPADYAGAGPAAGAPVQSEHDTAKDQPLVFSGSRERARSRVNLVGYTVSLLKA